MLSIGRFTLDTPPQRTAADAERLAHLIAERLRIAVPHVDELTNVDALNLTIRDHAGQSVDWLAAEIVDAIVRELDRLG
jgi:hypothetical protein